MLTVLEMIKPPLGGVNPTPVKRSAFPAMPDCPAGMVLLEVNQIPSIVELVFVTVGPFGKSLTRLVPISQQCPQVLTKNLPLSERLTKVQDLHQNGSGCR